MGLLSSLFAGVSGLNANGDSISIIGDNIANTNTVGFKSSRGEFVDVLSGNLGGVGGGGQIGAGARMAGINQNFTQGSLESTGVGTDMAVDGGGFFQVQDTEGVFYTRAGQFRMNSSQQLVNAQGQSVLGFGITPSGQPNGALGAIDLSQVASVPSATGEVDVNVNLDPNDTTLTGGAAGFDHTTPVTSSNFQTGIRVFDSLGNPRNILMYFRKSSTDNQWYYYAGVNRGELDTSAYSATHSFTASVAPTQFIPVQSGTLNFDTSGKLSSIVSTALSVPYDLNGDGTTTSTIATPQAWRWADGAAATTGMTFDFGSPTGTGGTGVDATTQFGGSSASGSNNFVRFMNQNGFSAGSLQNLEVDDNGFVTGNFSNGQTQRLAQVALTDFPNVNGLSRVGNNAWLETNTSGTPIIGSPNQGGFGAIRSGFLELSNTDLAEEFVKLILAQRSFQANTRTVSTTNELLAQLVMLGQ